MAGYKLMCKVSLEMLRADESGMCRNYTIPAHRAATNQSLDAGVQCLL